MRHHNASAGKTTGHPKLTISQQLRVVQPPQPGARGKREKDLTLAVAKELGAKLEKHLNVRVVLTRTDDTFVSLSDRTKLANKEQADIFISIHANSARRKGARGVETYFMSVDATDSEAEELAAVENNVDGTEGEANANAAPDFLKSILWDMVRNEAHHNSSRLAEIIHESLITATGGINRGVKQAPFKVLTGADMPAILIEVGFISNPKEERKLSTKTSRALIASSITAGVIDFEKEMRKRTGRLDTGKKISRNKTSDIGDKTQ